MKQTGGILISDPNHTKAFNIFLQNSTLTFLTNGSNGIIFKASIPSEEFSKYTHYDAYKFGIKVKDLVIKLIFINEQTPAKNKMNIIKFDNVSNAYNTTDIKTDDLKFFEFKEATQVELEEEVNIQTNMGLLS